MELRELRDFSTVMKLGSISKAVERLNSSQPTISLRIQRLEKELGVLLFERSKRPMKVTPAGIALAEKIDPLLETIDGLTEGASKIGEQGPIRIASTPDIIPHTLQRAVKAFLPRYPHVHIRIRSATSRVVSQLVSNGEVDIGFVPGPERNPSLEFLGLFGYERVLITPKDHELLHQPLTSIGQLAEWPLILMGPGTQTRAMLEGEFRRRSLSYEIVIELDSMDMIKEYVALGLGISVGPRLAIEPQDQEQIGVLSLNTLLPVEQAGILTLRGKRQSTAIDNFISVLKETLGLTTNAHVE
ncbi:LysR family transcriptional regulator [Dehalococcoidia bacterium]|nr:LysR family transcriptional regulator [Dehalococcoidia bacterium]